MTQTLTGGPYKRTNRTRSPAGPGPMLGAGESRDAFPTPLGNLIIAMSRPLATQSAPEPSGHATSPGGFGAPRSPNREPFSGLIQFMMIMMSVAVICYSHWPTLSPRQEIRWRDSTGTTHRFSLAWDDPRLAELRTELRVWNGEWPTQNLSMAKWMAEVAELYANAPASHEFAGPPDSTASPASETPAGSNVRPVSFEQSHDHAAAKTADPKAYWRDLSNSAAKVVAREEIKLAARQNAKTPPPFVLGEINDRVRHPQAITACLALGLVAAIIFWTWGRRFPVLQVSAEPAEAKTSQPLRSNRNPPAIRIEIPAHWVRIHQPVSVVSRQITSAILVLWALCSVLLI